MPLSRVYLFMLLFCMLFSACGSGDTHPQPQPDGDGDAALDGDAEMEVDEDSESEGDAELSDNPIEWVGHPCSETQQACNALHTHQVFCDPDSGLYEIRYCFASCVDCCSVGVCDDAAGCVDADAPAGRHCGPGPDGFCMPQNDCQPRASWSGRACDPALYSELCLDDGLTRSQAVCDAQTEQWMVSPCEGCAACANTR